MNVCTLKPTYKCVSFQTINDFLSVIFTFEHNISIRHCFYFRFIFYYCFCFRFVDLENWCTLILYPCIKCTIWYLMALINHYPKLQFWRHYFGLFHIHVWFTISNWNYKCGMHLQHIFLLAFFLSFFFFFFLFFCSGNLSICCYLCIFNKYAGRGRHQIIDTFLEKR